MSEEETPVCRLCKRPVVANRDQYEVFERMHWLCFHIIFEHCGDTDEPCGDPSCPHWHERVFHQKLEQLGYDPREVLNEAIDERYGL